MNLLPHSQNENPLNNKIWYNVFWLFFFFKEMLFLTQRRFLPFLPQRRNKPLKEINYKAPTVINRGTYPIFFSSTQTRTQTCASSDLSLVNHTIIDD